MKKVLAVLIFTAGALAAQASAASGTTAAKSMKKTVPAKQATTAQQPLTIPKDAVLNADGVYTYTDKQGKNWIYANTPFGVSRTEATAGTSASSSRLPVGVKAFDAGDKVRFEAPTPFGVTKWEKAKSDLTEDERNLLNSQNAKKD